ncbi:hypothetical protein [Amycolatopsis sp. WAC 01375]|uniref:hypothetical protein n=1 Tax=Amycolatopsis sp. WAC 01375 TaxID=2203194 RepID=UPI000F7A461C|nr:hypothetical protein [Amycolatopsis sp. WAC 01375]
MEPLSLSLPGQPWSVVAPSAAGPLYVLCTKVKELPNRRTLLAIDLAGNVLWQRELEGDPNGHWSQKSYTKHLRVSESGTVFLIDGDVLLGFDASGETQVAIRLDHDQDEAPGPFALVREGFCTTWTTLPGRHRDVRVDVRDGSGTCMWSTRIPTEPLGYRGPPGLEDDFAPFKPTMPHEFSPSYWDPLLVSGDRILAGFDDVSTGLSLSYLLDRDSGGLVATTPVSGGKHKAIAGLGEFLAGDRGFGLLGTARYDASRAEVVRWDSDGPLLVGPDGAIRSVESGNPEGARRFRKLNADGSTDDGPALSRSHFGSPALDSAGTVVFTQDGALRAIDAELHERVLCEIPDERDLYGRIVLLEDGLVAFTVGHGLFLAETDLGPLPSSGWVCSDGNLRANPVLESP